MLIPSWAPPTEAGWASLSLRQTHPVSAEKHAHSCLQIRFVAKEITPKPGFGGSRIVDEGPIIGVFLILKM